MKEKVKRIQMILFSSFIVVVLTLLAYSYYDRVHWNVSDIALKLLEQADRAGLYKEISLYGDLINKGAVQEDYGAVEGNERSFRHYYDPDTGLGLRYLDWFEYWIVIGGQVKKPKNDIYASALEWARNGAGTEDWKNWEGAIQAYGYTSKSREEAYSRLGHVIHLLTDMAEPDHATNTPHPGSGFKLPLGLYGYEKLLEEYRPNISGNVENIARFPTLDGYFNYLAKMSKDEIKKRGMTCPLGLKSIPVPNKRPKEGWESAAAVPWINALREGDRGKYIDLAHVLLNRAVELNAGLMMDFHDIVNQPPFVKSIHVTQNGGGNYIGQWDDGDSWRQNYDYVDKRNFQSYGKQDSFKVGKEITIKVEFGPDAAPVQEKVKEDSVKIKISAVGFEHEPEVKKIGDGTYQTKFVHVPSEPTHRTEYSIWIDAEDIHNHYSAYEGGLDSNPETPVEIVQFEPPYAKKGYEKGPDTKHKITAIDDYMLVKYKDPVYERLGYTVLVYTYESRFDKDDILVAGPIKWDPLKNVACPIVSRAEIDWSMGLWTIEEDKLIVPDGWFEMCGMPKRSEEPSKEDPMHEKATKEKPTRENPTKEDPTKESPIKEKALGKEILFKEEWIKRKPIQQQENAWDNAVSPDEKLKVNKVEQDPWAKAVDPEEKLRSVNAKFAKPLPERSASSPPSIQAPHSIGEFPGILQRMGIEVLEKLDSGIYRVQIFDHNLAGQYGIKEKERWIAGGPAKGARYRTRANVPKEKGHFTCTFFCWPENKDGRIRINIPLIEVTIIDKKRLPDFIHLWAR
jgi:hypothetical protein